MRYNYRHHLGGEEYFDAEEWLSEDNEDEESLKDDSSDNFLLPQGRSKQLNIFLINYPERPIYEPLLQVIF